MSYASSSVVNLMRILTRIGTLAEAGRVPSKCKNVKPILGRNLMIVIRLY